MIEAERERRQADTTRGVFTCRDLFTVISYADPATASAVALALTVAAPGRLDTTIWRPNLSPATCSSCAVNPPALSTSPETSSRANAVVLSTDDDWSGGDAIPSTHAPLSPDLFWLNIG